MTRQQVEDRLIAKGYTRKHVEACLDLHLIIRDWNEPPEGYSVALSQDDLSHMASWADRGAR